MTTEQIALKNSVDLLDSQIFQTAAIPHDFALLQFHTPSKQLPLRKIYMEVTIISCVKTNSNYGYGIGLAPPNIENMTGWYDWSIGYHGDNGYIYDSTGNDYFKHKAESYGQGDTIGIMFDLYNGFVKFTKNGLLLSTKTAIVRNAEDQFLFTFTSCNVDAQFKVNFGDTPFLWSGYEEYDPLRVLYMQKPTYSKNASFLVSTGPNEFSYDEGRDPRHNTMAYVEFDIPEFQSIHKCFYFEVQVLQNQRSVRIRLNPDDVSESSYIEYVNDGKVKDPDAKVLMKPYQSGDVVGLFYDFNTKEVMFTKNGAEVITKTNEIPYAGIPCIATQGASFRVNLGEDLVHMPFRYCLLNNFGVLKSFWDRLRSMISNRNLADVVLIFE
jgi:hypothetical protein